MLHEHFQFMGKITYSILSSIYSQREADTGEVPSNRYTYTVETADVTVSVTRNGAAYSINLQLQQQGEEWKIINLDGL